MYPLLRPLLFALDPEHAHELTLKALCAPGAWLVALIKPQFEVGPGAVGKGGVVREAVQHRAVVSRIEAWLGALPGWRVLGVTESPITGPEGNREFLIAARRES